jgi:hypothetical protein
METEYAERQRDLRLRRLMLRLLHAARTRPVFGWVDGRFVFDMVEGAMPATRSFTDEGHCVALLRDLTSAGYVEARDDRTRTRQPYGLDYTSYRITARGTALVEEHIEPDPLVGDERVRTNQRKGE